MIHTLLLLSSIWAAFVHNNRSAIRVRMEAWGNAINILAAQDPEAH